MNILIVGVSGFIGKSIYYALSQDGHHLQGCSRHEVPDINWNKFDFRQNQNAWEQQLQKIDLVINAAGIYQQSEQHISNDEGFFQVHDLGPKVLFDACRKCHVKVIQISAIGADQENPPTDFLQSKRNADQYLLTHELPNVVLYPGIVLGEHGRSTRQLSLLACLFCIPLIFGRQKNLPLISIYQIIEFIKETINHWPETSTEKVLVAKAETMENLLINLRHWMGLGKNCFIGVPKQLTNLAFYFFPKLSIGAFNQQSVVMLADYSNKTMSVDISGDESASESLLKHKATKQFKKDIQIKKLFYINLFVLGIIWIVSGLSSLINFDQSRELISLIGVKGNWGDAIIFTAASGDILLGLALWAGSFYQSLRKWALYIQIVVMIIYSAILAIMLPTFLLHPFAPIVKNLALLVLAMYLLVEEKRV